MAENIYCISCKYDDEFSEFCKNPKGRHKIKTPWRPEYRYTLQVTQNANNDCPWFEPIERPTNVIKGALWKVYRFLFGKERPC